MQNENEIWLELKEISPLLADMDLKKGQFELPQGYFDGLPEEILSRVKSLAKDSSEEELSDLSPLMGSLEKHDPYKVPSGYFDIFPGKMMALIRSADAATAAEELEILSPVLSRLDKQMPYSTPQGYFEELSRNLAGGINAVELVNDDRENLSPLMRGLKKENVYGVPENYFERFPEKLLEKIKAEAKPGMVLSFYSRKPFLKYAAAAALTGILITIGLFTFNRHSNAGVDPLTALAKASDQEILGFLANQDILLSEKVSSSTAALELSDNDVRDLFDEIPDADLQQYVNERGGGKDLITN